jgi:Raf kinase inhibitor-like YbhB/YbcL family protein
MTFTLRSPAFAAGEAIPTKCTCEGETVSPPLSWSGAPDGTRAFALVMDDPDAPGGTFTHWLLWDIAPTCTSLAEGLAEGRLGTAGRNDFGRPGYGGPCPPKGRGPHRYRFHLHALRAPIGLPKGKAREAVDAALEGRVLATAILEGVFER